jgi:hypothetical protein
MLPRRLATGFHLPVALARTVWEAYVTVLAKAPRVRTKLQDSVQILAFNPDGKSFFVATGYWLNTYSWVGKLQNSRLLHGYWKGFRFSTDCDGCLEVALADTGNCFHLETLDLDGPIDPPIEGDPGMLREKWKGRLGLKFDEQMRPVPAVDIPGAPAEVVSGGKLSTEARRR